jgi:hypothetical protein
MASQFTFSTKELKLGTAGDRVKCIAALNYETLTLKPTFTLCKQTNQQRTHAENKIIDQTGSCYQARTLSMLTS